MSGRYIGTGQNGPAIPLFVANAMSVEKNTNGKTISSVIKKRNTRVKRGKGSLIFELRCGRSSLISFWNLTLFPSETSRCRLSTPFVFDQCGPQVPCRISFPQGVLDRVLCCFE